MYFDKTIPFATADTHYFHSNIIKPEYCDRPFKNEKAMRTAMIERYNKTVGPDDDCFFMGDIAMMSPSQWERLKGILFNLNGRKHLILGNHDEIKPFRLQECGFKSVHTWLDVDVKIWNKVRKFRLCHDSNSSYIYGNVTKDRVLLCGHVHDLFKIIPNNNTINVGVDVWNFYPISFRKAWKTLEDWKVKMSDQLGDCVIQANQEVS